MSRFFLSRSSGRLCLTSRSSERSPLYVDFTTPALMQRVKRLSPRSELLLKAIGGQPGETVVDMTTGLGTDSFLLAAYGYRVFSIERSRTLYLLLRDGLNRALADPSVPEWLQKTLARIHLINADARSVSLLPNESVYAVIDPMYAPRKKSALSKGEMQTLQAFIGQNQSPGELISASKSLGVRRAVVKRALRSELHYASFEPLYVLRGRSSRFDVFHFK